MITATATATTDHAEALPWAVTVAGPGELVITPADALGGTPMHDVWLGQDHVGVVRTERAGEYVAWAHQGPGNGTVGTYPSLGAAAAAIRPLGAAIEEDPREWTGTPADQLRLHRFGPDGRSRCSRRHHPRVQPMRYGGHGPRYRSRVEVLAERWSAAYTFCQGCAGA